VEITHEWYAQDKAGNIWYLGEYVPNYKNGRDVGHGGSRRVSTVRNRG
jgi:hypothetical protein